MEACKYFAKGFCKYGAGCRHAHDQPPDNPSHVQHFTLISRASEKVKPRLPCAFFLKGACYKGENCTYDHSSAPSQQQQAPRIASPLEAGHPQQGGVTSQELRDSRAEIPCKFLSYPGGCQKADCRFLHPSSGQDLNAAGSTNHETGEDEARSPSLALCSCLG